MQTTFQSDTRIEFHTPRADVEAGVRNNRKAWLSFGPPIVPLIPWPAGEIPQLSHWSALTTSVRVENPEQVLVIDFAEAHLLIKEQRVAPTQIRANCKDATQTGTIVRLQPRSTRCFIDLAFGLPPQELTEFDLVVGTVILGSERHRLPTAHFTRRSNLDYRPLALPLL